MAREIILVERAQPGDRGDPRARRQRRGRERLEIAEAARDRRRAARLWAWKKARGGSSSPASSSTSSSTRSATSRRTRARLIGGFAAASGAAACTTAIGVGARRRGRWTDERLQRAIDLRCDEICRERVAEERAQNRAIRVAVVARQTAAAARKVRKDEGSGRWVARAARRVLGGCQLARCWRRAREAAAARAASATCRGARARGGGRRRRRG